MHDFMNVYAILWLSYVDVLFSIQLVCRVYLLFTFQQCIQSSLSKHCRFSLSSDPCLVHARILEERGPRICEIFHHLTNQSVFIIFRSELSRARGACGSNDIMTLP